MTKQIFPKIIIRPYFCLINYFEEHPIEINKYIELLKFDGISPKLLCVKYYNQFPRRRERRNVRRKFQRISKL